MQVSTEAEPGEFRYFNHFTIEVVEEFLVFRLFFKKQDHAILVVCAAMGADDCLQSSTRAKAILRKMGVEDASRVQKEAEIPTVNNELSAPISVQMLGFLHRQRQGEIMLSQFAYRQLVDHSKKQTQKVGAPPSPFKSKVFGLYSCASEVFTSFLEEFSRKSDSFNPTEDSEDI